MLISTWSWRVEQHLEKGGYWRSIRDCLIWQELVILSSTPGTVCTNTRTMVKSGHSNTGLGPWFSRVVPIDAKTGALVCEAAFVPFIGSDFLPEYIWISSTYPLFPFNLMSISPEVVRQLVSDTDVWPVLSRGVEKIAVTNTFEMYTVPLPLSLLHKVKTSNWKTIFIELSRLNF